MKRVDSSALQEMKRVLGLTGAGAPITEFEDSRLVQVMDAAPVVRRSRTLGISEGIFEGVLQNTHAIADTQLSTAAPYNLTAGRIAPWPAPVPRGLDVWVLRAQVRQVSGAGTFQGALFTNYDAAAQGWGVDQAGAAVVASAHSVVMAWDGLRTDTFVYGTMNGNLPILRPFRLLRGIDPGTTLNFSSTSSAAAVFECQLLMGLFPTALGQDAAL